MITWSRASASELQRRPESEMGEGASPATGDTTALVERAFELVGIEVTAPTEDVIETGVLDSLALVSLIAEIEQLAGIEIPFETLEVDDFRTVESIGRLVDRQRGGGS